MKVKMLSNACGPDVQRFAGKVYDVPQAEAAAYVKGGYAEPVVEDLQTATVAMPGKTADSVPSTRKGK